MEKSSRHHVEPFGRKKRIDITIFRGELYFHLNDIMKSKSFTLNKKEFRKLCTMNSKLSKHIKKLENVIKLEKKAVKSDDSSSDNEVGTKKRKKNKHSNADSSDDDSCTKKRKKNKQSNSDSSDESSS